jgi:carbon monoxide dehydrogenase subunit G
MPRARRSRVIASPPQHLWEVLEDPHQMPRWWPGVDSMEDVAGGHFTQVFRIGRGRAVRLDFRVVASDAPYHRAWEQVIERGALARVLRESITEVVLEPEGEGTRVTIEQRQKLRGFRTGIVWSRARRRRLDQVLDGLERITS